jgi:cell division protein FtsA
MGAIVGIDIGSHSVKAIFGESIERNRIKILAVAERRSEDEMIVDGEIEIVTTVSEVISDLLDELASKVAIPGQTPMISHVNININGRELKRERKSNSLHLSHGKVIDEKDINTIYKEFCRINHQNESVSEIIHLVPEYFQQGTRKIYTEPRGREINGSLKLDASIFTCKKSYLTKIRQTIDSIKAKGLQENLKIDKLVISSFAPCVAVLDNEKKKSGVIVVDIGHTITDICIFKNGTLRFQKQLLIAGESITKDLTTAFKIKKDAARKIKHEYISLQIDTINPHDYIQVGNDERTAKKISVLNASLVAEARLIELITMIDAEIELSGIDKDDLIEGIILTGGTANIDGIANLMCEITNLDTNLGDVSEFVESVFSETDQLDYATAIGLTLWDVRSFDVFAREKHAPPVLIHKEAEVLATETASQKPKPAPSPSRNPFGVFNKLFKKVEGDDFDTIND